MSIQFVMEITGIELVSIKLLRKESYDSPTVFFKPQPLVVPGSCGKKS